jgi:hypothetical protein
LFDFYQKNIDIPRELPYSPAAGRNDGDEAFSVRAMPAGGRTGNKTPFLLNQKTIGKF